MPSRARFAAPVVATVLFLLASVAVALSLYGIVSGLVFAGDEWLIAVERRTPSLDALLRPHDGALRAVPIALYEVLFAWKGLLTYHHYAAMLVAAHVTAAGILAIVCGRRAGPWIGLGAGILLLVLGWAAPVLLSPLEVGAPISVGAGLVAWWLWDATRPAVWRDALGAGAIATSIAAGPAGIVFLAASAAVLAVQAGDRRRLLWPLLVAAAAGTWFVAYGWPALPTDVVGVTVDGWPDAVRLGLAATAGAFLGVDARLGALVALGLAALLAALVASGRVRPAPRFWIALTAAIAVHLLASPGPAGLGESAGDGRFVYASVALAAVAAAELAASLVTRPIGSRERAVTGAVAGLWLVAVVAGGVGALEPVAHEWRARAEAIKAQLATAQLFEPTTASLEGRAVDEAHFGGLTFGHLRALREALGLPVGAAPGFVTGRDAAARLAADRFVVGLAAGDLAPRLADAAPETVLAGDPRPGPGVERVGSTPEGCARFLIGGNDPRIEISLSAGRLFVRSDRADELQVFYRLFGASHQGGASFRRLIEGEAWYVLAPPSPPEGRAWNVRLDPGAQTQRLDVCLAEPLPASPVVVRLVPVLSGLDDPLWIGHAGDGSARLFVVERAGTVRLVEDGALRSEPFLDLRDRVVLGGERGLLSLAFHPAFERNRRLFASWNEEGGDLVLAEYRATGAGDRADPASQRILMRIPMPTAQHNGGMLAFGPDGYLYFSTGDGTYIPDSGRAGTGQEPTTRRGVIVRIDVDRDDGAGFAVPADNPAVDPDAPEVWAYGLRNPWRFSFDRQTGDLWIGDVGHRRIEEINFQPASSRGGENYGWNVMEGTECYFVADCDRSGLTLPVAQYRHAGTNCAVVGGYVYRGAAIAGLDGRYLYGDYCSGRIWTLESAGAAPEVLIPGGPLVSAFGEDESGELYLAAMHEGVIYRLAAPE